MGPVGITAKRSAGEILGRYSTALLTGLFMMASAVLLIFGLASAEGTSVSFCQVWAMSVAPALPVYAALLAMFSWSDERATGRMDMMLTTAVRERDIVFGKFCGVWTVTLAAVLLHFAGSVLAISFMSPELVENVTPSGVLPVFAILALQAALWCALTECIGVFTSMPAVAACMSIMISAVLPRLVWYVLIMFMPAGHASLGALPMDADVVDIANGKVSGGAVASYVIAMFTLLFIATNGVAGFRFRGGASVAGRVSLALASLLSVVFAVLLGALAFRLNMTFSLPVADDDALSTRTRRIFSETSGRISVTCVVPRGTALFDTVAAGVRSLKRGADAAGGVSMDIRFVDPQWDIGAMRHMADLGVTGNAIVFERGWRNACVPVVDGFDERACASVIRRLTSPVRRRSICWTVGHDEIDFSAYDAFGMSDIARDLADDGFENLPLDLSGETGIPADCSLVVIAGARYEFSRDELARLGVYLGNGGRLLVLTGSADIASTIPLLSSWGIAAKTIVTGAGREGAVMTGDFADHAISSGFGRSRIVLEHPIGFTMTTAFAGSGADRVEFTPLASSDGETVVALAERGVGMGEDLSIRPARIVLIGDPAFAINGSLARRANANREFFLNCISYLAGNEIVSSGGGVSRRLECCLDERARARLSLIVVGAVPAVWTLLLIAITGIRRRHR